MHKFLLSFVLIFSVAATARAQVSFDFATDSHNWVGTGGWEYAPSIGDDDPEKGVWRTPGSTVSLVTYFTSPILYVSTTGTVSVSTSHWYSFEPNYDGGRFEFTTDGGVTWNVVTNDLFTQNPYSAVVVLGDYNQQIGGSVFSPSPEPYGYHTSLLTLGTGGSENGYETGGVAESFEASTAIQFRFLASWGDDDAGGGFNWLVEDISFTNTTLTSAIPEPSTYALVGGMLALGVVVVRRRWLRRAV